MRSFWITGHPAADLESGPGEVRAAKIPMELGTERAAGPGESEASNSELQWVSWLRKQTAGTYTLAQGRGLLILQQTLGLMMLLHAIHLYGIIQNRL